jgi:hypothetical protein
MNEHYLQELKEELLDLVKSIDNQKAFHKEITVDSLNKKISFYIYDQDREKEIDISIRG